MITGTRVVVEVPDDEQYHGRMEGLCGNMDGEPEEQDASLPHGMHMATLRLKLSAPEPLHPCQNHVHWLVDS